MYAGKIAVGLLTIRFLLMATAFCQFKLDKPVLITKENGLPVNGVRCMARDKKGFVWIGTGEGLCRFDGQQVKVYTEGSNLKTSVFEKTIYAVLPVDDEVWVGTHQGISVLNTRNETFRHYQLNSKGKEDSLKRRFDQYVSVLYRDRAGDIWVGTRERGVCRYDPDKDNFQFYSLSRENFPPLFPSLGSDLSILSIKESSNNDSIIWAGTTAGLKEINKKTGECRLYTFPQPGKDYQIALNAFRRLYHHEDGLLYVGSWGAGMNVFDPDKKTFMPLSVKNAEGKKILGSVITTILRKSEHEMWISAGDGLVVYDTRLKDVTWFKFSKTTEMEFYGVQYIDDANRLWHYNINGLNYFDPVMQQFSTYSFRHLYPSGWAFAFYIIADESGNNITVCPRFADGLFHYNRKEGKWTKSPFPGNETFQTERDVVRGFVQIAGGEYILSCDRGIFQYSATQNRIINLKHILPVAGPTRRGAILLDRSGNLWLSDDLQGLIKWKPGSKQYKVYKNELFQLDSGSASRFENLFEDSRGNIWFQRGNGLGVYLPVKDSIINFLYSENESNSFPLINAFAEDRKGRVWVSGGDGWLGYALSVEPSKGLVFKMNIREQNLSGSLQKLATDNFGDVWGYTLKGLVKINADNLKISTFSFQYGSGRDDFFHFSFLPSGEMIFGGRNDITIANPAELKRNTELPIPYISEIKVLNQPYNFTNGQKLKLRYRQNFFSIGFSAIAYTMAKDVKFRYRLRGFDEWSEPANRHFANYTNVPGGDYIFQLQAANNEGVWNEDILEFPMYVSTPFWLTWPFRIAVILVVTISVYWFYRNRINQLRKKEKLKSDYEKKLANVEMTALLAQMNPHFLFNSLNSIDSYIIRNESKKASEYLNNFARLMRLILQNSRSNYISLKDELEALELYLQMESLRFRDKFSFSITVDKNVDSNSIVIPPMLIQPYVENAIWHGLMHKTNGEHRKVELYVEKADDNLVCIIKDNGIGRKRAAQLKEQKPTRHKRSMGMQITRDRLEIINKLYNINATVEISDLEDKEGKALGTKVELSIPV